jgi:hypothetical protein
MLSGVVQQSLSTLFDRWKGSNVGTTSSSPDAPPGRTGSMDPHGNVAPREASPSSLLSQTRTVADLFNFEIDPLLRFNPVHSEECSPSGFHPENHIRKPYTCTCLVPLNPISFGEENQTDLSSSSNSDALYDMIHDLERITDVAGDQTQKGTRTSHLDGSGKGKDREDENSVLVSLFCQHCIGLVRQTV